MPQRLCTSLREIEKQGIPGSQGWGQELDATENRTLTTYRVKQGQSLQHQGP